ncbi:MAG: zinc ribbon domain-containing protein [Myxococcota bacterium]|nr:zinc ribbon domain-containing protein [Myxococcota bacterium]
MLIFLATFFGVFTAYMVYQSIRPLVESAVVTSDDWQRIDDHSMALIGRRDRLLDELRDLEFEASLNKIWASDLESLRQRYETEALAVMARLESEAQDFSERIAGDIDAVVEEARARRDATSTGSPEQPPIAQQVSAAVVATNVDKASQVDDVQPPASVHVESNDETKSAARVCRSCGTENRATARFCDGCGAALEVSV